MIFAHIIAGAMPIDQGHFSPYFFLGSVFPDVDHLVVLARHHIYKWANIVESIEHERRYHIHYRTPFVHSFLGALIISAPVFYLTLHGGAFFLGGYLGHLVLDWPDIDEKRYLYPLKMRFKGVLPVFSDFEKAFTICLAALYVYILMLK